MQSDVVPRPDFEPPHPHVVGARAGAGTGLAVTALVGLGTFSLSASVLALGASVVVGAAGGVLLDRACRDHDSATLPLAFTLLGALSGGLLLPLLLESKLLVASLFAGTTLVGPGMALGLGALLGALLGGAAGVVAGRPQPDAPLPGALRAGAVAGLGSFGVAAALVTLVAGFSPTGPVASSLLWISASLSVFGAGKLGLIAGVAATSGMLLASARAAWAEQEAPAGPLLGGDLLHRSSQDFQAMLHGEDPTLPPPGRR